MPPPRQIFLLDQMGGGSGGGSVVVVQSLGRGLGVSAELIPMGAGDRFKSGVERIGNGAV